MDAILHGLPNLRDSSSRNGLRNYGCLMSSAFNHLDFCLTMPCSFVMFYCIISGYISKSLGHILCKQVLFEFSRALKELLPWTVTDLNPLWSYEPISKKMCK